MVPEIHVLPDPFNFTLQLLATLVLFLVLRHFLWDTVKEFLNKRQESVQNDLDRAEKEKVEAMKLKEEYQAKIEDAKGEGKEIIESSRKKAEDIKEDIVNNAKKESNDMINRAKKEIEREQRQARMELKNEVVELAMLAASKVIDKNLDKEAHAGMIDKFIDEVGESKWQN
ncbi:F0F1 ATP synthase subunit B [Senegalia massiliensis]|jgi:F-type H+-transporting ATPase subunit b|uniref:F0F1 ATP synthase subunit B n=1 Tax=Senegalia massiliensis TaxID=1720316 RepID=UPI0010327276|nr:F0F1 ATP synthase subunit B [Senegalia massiliensis]